ncbi:hypothetical protein LPJ66_011816, partial [Kickxella alabastrina]
DKLDRAELASSCTRRITSCGNTDVKTEGWVPDPADPSREMCMYNYEKPLGFAIGPKSTMVEDTFRIVKRDFDQCVVVEQSVRTPNVPSGTAFCVKIRHCLSWTAGPSNEPPGGWSHYRMTFEVEWTKSSWIKNAIEKGSNDSNKQAGEALEKFIREWIAKHPDMEVKARAGIVPATNGGSSGAAAANKKGKAHKRGSRKRMESPRGLRMEELVVAADKGSNTATASEPSNLLGNGGQRHTTNSTTGADINAAAAGGSKATESRVSAASAGAASILGGLRDLSAVHVLVAVLVLVLVLSNGWRFSWSLPYSSSDNVFAEVRELRASVESLSKLVLAIFILGQCVCRGT